MTATRPLAAASFALLALLFTGCAAGGSGSTDAAETGSKGEAVAAPADQSTEEACATMQASLEDFIEKFSGEGASDLMSDPAAAVKSLKEAESAMQAAAGQVGNADVADAAHEAADAMTEFTTVLDGLASDPANADFAAISEAQTNLQEGISALGEVCTA